MVELGPVSTEKWQYAFKGFERAHLDAFQDSRAEYVDPSVYSIADEFYRFFNESVDSS